MKFYDERYSEDAKFLVLDWEAFSDHNRVNYFLMHEMKHTIEDMASISVPKEALDAVMQGDVLIFRVSGITIVLDMSGRHDTGATNDPV